MKWNKSFGQRYKAIGLGPFTHLMAIPVPSEPVSLSFLTHKIKRWLSNPHNGMCSYILYLTYSSFSSRWDSFWRVIPPKLTLSWRSEEWTTRFSVWHWLTEFWNFSVRNREFNQRLFNPCNQELYMKVYVSCYWQLNWFSDHFNSGISWILFLFIRVFFLINKYFNNWKMILFIQWLQGYVHSNTLLHDTSFILGTLRLSEGKHI